MIEYYVHDNDITMTTLWQWCDDIIAMMIQWYISSCYHHDHDINNAMSVMIRLQRWNIEAMIMTTAAHQWWCSVGAQQRKEDTNNTK